MRFHTIRKFSSPVSIRNTPGLPCPGAAEKPGAGCPCCFRALGTCFANKDSIKGYHVLTAEWSAGLTKLLNLVPVGRSSALDVAQFRRIFDNSHILRPPVPGMTNGYSQTDLLKNLASVARVADADGVMRLVKALKQARAPASGCRYALSVVADLVKNHGATAVQCINKYAGRRGGTDLDVWCTLGGRMRIIEIKSTLAAFGNLRSHKHWLDRVKTGWGIGPSLPLIEYRSPLLEKDIPKWLDDLNETSDSGIKYVKSILFK